MKRFYLVVLPETQNQMHKSQKAKHSFLSVLISLQLFLHPLFSVSALKSLVFNLPSLKILALLHMLFVYLLWSKWFQITHPYWLTLCISSHIQVHSSLFLSLAYSDIHFIHRLIEIHCLLAFLLLVSPISKLSHLMLPISKDP